jgi:hypothetical protein
MSTEHPSSPYLIQDISWLKDLPDGHVVTMELEPADQVPPFQYLLVGLGTEQQSYNLATLRMHRAGGSNAADLALRRNLFTLVGAITVAGGHIEAEMKRIIIQAEEDRGATFVDVDETWTGLEKRLDAIATGDGPFAADVAAALEWGRKKGIKKTRDDAVHSTWCLYDVGTVQRSRFRRRTEDETHLGQLETFMSHVPKMFEYASRLSHIGSWPTAIFPPLPELKAQEIVALDLETEVTKGS